MAHRCTAAALAIATLVIGGCTAVSPAKPDTPPATPSPQFPAPPVAQPGTPQPDLTLYPLDLVPTETASLSLGGAQWRIVKPAGYEPVVAAGDAGILWVRYPPLVRSKELVRPAGDFTVLYTPLRAAGGDLADGAQPILTIPGAEGQDYVRWTQVEAAADGRFLVHTYTIFPGAQTGGTARVWWVYPKEKQARVLLAGTSGGGSHQTVLSNGRWLFWNQGRTDSQGIAGGKAGLVNLLTGEGREVQLAGDHWAMDPHWAADGRLLFQLAGKQQALDPATGAVVPLP